MIVLSEDSPRLSPTPSARSLHSVTEAARIVGCPIHYIPQQEICDSAQNALSYVPVQQEVTPAIWVGYIPDPAWYAAIYDEALQKRIQLLNSPEQHLIAQEFDRAYEMLKGITPVSVVISAESECESAIAELGLPVFVKGTIQSRKAKGWTACVAETPDELRRLCRQLLDLDLRSRGRVVVRQLVRLRYSRVSGMGFPFGREYRVFLYRGDILGYGYYWEGEDPLRNLSQEETHLVLNLAREAASRVSTPYIAIDIGQVESGEWIVIETGDAQFSGTSQTPLLTLWNRIQGITIPEG